MMLVTRTVITEDHPFNKLFETGPAGSVLNEYFESCNDVVKVLFLSCTDLRKPLCCIDRSFPYRTLELHINNSSTSVIARNVLIAKILSNVDKDSLSEDLVYIWDIWYNVSWKKSHSERFKKDVQELLDGNLPEKINIPDEKHIESLKKLWFKWLFICESNEENLSHFLKKRSSFMEERWNEIHNRGQVKVPLNQVLDTLNQQMENTISSDNQASLGERAKEEISHFYRTGVCKITEDSTDHINPTFLNFTRYSWSAEYSSPFECYLPFCLRKEQALIDQCLEKLKNIISNFMEQRDRISFFLHICDPVSFCLDNPMLNFSVIYCSDLADQVGLANLLLIASRKLERNQEAVLVTDSTTWSTLSQSIVQYIEIALCTSITLIPTLYGLTLMNHPHLGHEDPFDIVNMSTVPVSLRWKRAEPYNNMYPAPSLNALQMINQLKEWCFFLPEKLLVPEELCGMRNYTPLTIGHVILSMVQRLKWTLEDVEKLLPTALDRRFDLSIKLMKDWLTGSPWMRVSSKKSVTEDQLHNFLVEEFSFLRVAVTDLQTSEEFYLDSNINFRRYQDQNNELVAVSLDFLLPKNHNLNPSSTVTIQSIKSSNKYLFGTLHQFQEVYVECDLLSAETLSFQRNSSDLPADRCTEFEDRYEVDFDDHQVNVETPSLFITVLKLPPKCECGHQVEIRKLESTVTVTFSWPVESSEVQIHPFEENDRRGHRVIFKKSLSEPWPCEWLNPIKWDPEQLKVWESLYTQQDLSIHLSSQFYFRDLQANVTGTAANMELLNKSTALREVRCTIQSLFIRTLVDRHSYFAVRDERRPDQNPDWYLRVHLPLRISPSGSPILLLSAYDQRTARKLHEDGRLNLQTSLNQMKRVLDMQPSTEVVTVLTYTDEEAKLLRYVLRLNSTKIIPTSWQRENFDDENSPWLATFISPLYVDHPGSYPEIEDLIGAVQAASSEPLSTESLPQDSLESKKSCASCKKEQIEMKRCGRCKAVFYCSVQCQRNDWRTHKLLCST